MDLGISNVHPAADDFLTHSVELQQAIITRQSPSHVRKIVLVVNTTVDETHLHHLQLLYPFHTAVSGGGAPTSSSTKETLLFFEAWGGFTQAASERCENIISGIMWRSMSHNIRLPREPFVTSNQVLEFCWLMSHRHLEVQIVLS